MVTGTTKNIGIIGYSIEHSLSLTIQNTDIANEKIDYTYVTVPFLLEELGTLVEQGAATFQNIYPSSNIMQKALEEVLVEKD